MSLVTRGIPNFLPDISVCCCDINSTTNTLLSVWEHYWLVRQVGPTAISTRYWDLPNRFKLSLTYKPISTGHVTVQRTDLLCLTHISGWRFLFFSLPYPWICSWGKANSDSETGPAGICGKLISSQLHRLTSAPLIYNTMVTLQVWATFRSWNSISGSVWARDTIFCPFCGENTLKSATFLSLGWEDASSSAD